MVYKMTIKKDIHIEDLIDILPQSAQYLSAHGIKCIACGEPIWGTLEEAARDKGFNDIQIESFVREFNEMLNKEE